MFVEGSSSLFLYEVKYCLACIYRRSATDRHNNICIDVSESFHAVLDARDGRMLSYLIERPTKGVVLLENIGDLLDHVRLSD